SGSTFLEISKKNFKGLKITIPPAYLLDAFSKIVHPLIQQMEVLTKSIAKFQESRDRLLPKLMNGEIEV
ncbi:MAG: restriction endonuclease subunit S, partial [Oligosphaeraceae bacterium]